MKRETYYYGRPGLKWGIWNAQAIVTSWWMRSPEVQ